MAQSGGDTELATGTEAKPPGPGASLVERTIAAAEERKRRAQPPDARTYALARFAGKVVFGACIGPRVIGLEHVPREGPLLVVANHLSFLEPPLIGTVIPRRITFLALHELFEIRWLALVLRAMSALAVKRGGARDLDAIRAALELLKHGEAVAIFPEGRRSVTPGLLRANPGISLLAHRSGAPILPIGISGTERLEAVGRFLGARFQRPRVRMVIGKPFHPDFSGGRPDHQAVADAVMRRVAELMPERYRGEYRSGKSEVGSGK
jgi:1-acyl-sn-glycerol-3-phosphate acyltransferase